MRQPGNVLAALLPLAVAIASVSLNTRLGAAASHRVCQAAVIPGLLCVYGSGALAWAAAQGLRFTQAAEVPRGVFKFLGWMLLLASFVPVLMNRGT